jgi:thiol:disulfide interchange protein
MVKRLRPYKRRRRRHNMSKEEDVWAFAVLVSTIILIAIFIFKILFWVSIIALIVGVIWLLINNTSNESPLIPALVILISLILIPTSYYIGYQFEKSEIGEPIVTGARTIVDADKQIQDIPKNISDELNKINYVETTSTS